MRAFGEDLKRLLRGGGFWGSLVLMAVFQWIGGQPGSDSTAVDVLTLPFLASLPFAAQSWKELSSGAARMAIFRCGWRTWQLSKIMVSIISVFGICAVRMGEGIGGWLLLSGFYACIGAAASVVCQDSTIGCIIPMAVSFALYLLGGRFWPEILWLRPEYWLMEELWIMRAALFGGGIIVYGLVLRKELSRYV